MKKITLVIPCFNEEENIYPFFNLCKETLNKNFLYEFIYINDGSKDKTFEMISSLIKENIDENIIGINFSRNFGKEAAILAGLKSASGDYISVIDADLQQNPKYVNEMVNLLELNQTLDMVAAYQDKRREGSVHRFFKKLFYSLINKISETHFEKDASDFRTFTSNVKDAILSLEEYNRFSKGIFSWVGFNVEYIPYQVEDRKFGKTTWSLKSLTKYAIEGFVGFSTVPLKIATILGFITSIFSILYMLFIIGQKIFVGIDIEGYATIVTLILFFSGLILLSLGIIGEYLSKIYLEVKNRPHYIVKEIIESKKHSTY